MTPYPPTTPQPDHDTDVIVFVPPAPVFVDSTGRRRRFLRRASYAFGALCMVYGGLISVSLAGGPVSSSAVLPLPDLNTSAGDAAVAEAPPTPIPAPSSTTPAPQPLIESQPRRDAPQVREVADPATPPLAPRRTPEPERASATASTPPAPAPAISRTLESTGRPTPLPSSPAGTPTSPAPLPPLPPSTSGTGGAGGGTGIGDEPKAGPTGGQGGGEEKAPVVATETEGME